MACASCLADPESMGNKKSAAGCQSPADPPAPTVRQAAQHLLDAITLLFDDPEGVGFHGWENSRGEPVGDVVEDARQQLALVLAATRQPRLLTGANFDEEIFEQIWRSEAV